MIVESFSVMMHWFTRLGRQMRTAWGRTILSIVLPWLTPREREASV